jgi:hypothetical protein
MRSKRMRPDKCVAMATGDKAHSPWADKGSKRYLWNEESLAAAIDYVLNEQGDDLPDLE